MARLSPEFWATPHHTQTAMQAHREKVTPIPLHHAGLISTLNADRFGQLICLQNHNVPSILLHI